MEHEDGVLGFLEAVRTVALAAVGMVGLGLVVVLIFSLQRVAG